MINWEGSKLAAPLTRAAIHDLQTSQEAMAGTCSKATFCTLDMQLSILHGGLNQLVKDELNSLVEVRR